MEQKRNTSLRISNKQSKLLPRDISESMGKLPPQALDLEEAVLGAVMLEKSAFLAVADILQPDTFYSEAHREIWSAIRELFKVNEPIDMRTVVNQLRTEGKLELVGGAYYIAELTSKVSSAANIEYHARVVIEMSVLREMIQVASEIHQEAYEDTTDVFILIDKIQGKIDTITHTYFRNNFVDALTLYKRTLEKIIKSRNNEGITGISTGFSELDRITGGLQAPNLIVIAARPSMGKSVVAVTIAKNAAKMFKKPTALFSLETGSEEVMNRMISSESEIDLDKILTGSTTEQELIQMGEKSSGLANIPLFIDDTPGLSILELRAKCRRLKHEKNIELIIVDYIQLMRGDEDAGNREQEIASISRGLKGIAKELGIPVIALSQLSRAVETRGGEKRPQLSDLRESGSIEQDADIVWFLYRPEYYKITVDEEGFPTQGLMEVIIAKNRNGKTGSVKLKFIGKYSKIMSFSESSIQIGEGTFRKLEQTIPFDVRDTSQTEVEKPNDDMPF